MKTTTMETLAIFGKHSWRYKGKIIVIVIGLAITVGINALNPLILKRLVDSAYADNSEAKEIMMLLVFYLFATQLSVQAFWRVLGFINNRFQPQVKADLARTGFNYLLSHSQGFFENNFVGSLIAKLKRYPPSFERIADVITWNFVPTFINVILLVIVMTYFWPLVGLLVVMWAIAYVGFSYKYSLFKLPYDKEAAGQDTKVTAYMSDVISNNSNVHLFASRQFEIAGYKAVTEIWRKLMQRSWDLTTKGEIVQSLCTSLLMLGSMSVGVYLHKQGSFSGAEFVLLYLYLRDLSNNLWDVGRHIRTVYSSLADADELTDMLATPHGIPDKPNATELIVRKGNVRYENVSFCYPGQPCVLNDFSLSIRPGEKVGLVGESGAGKTTIAKLLFRNMDVTSGAVTIDGHDLRDVTQDSLHNAVTLVPQDPNLFHRSLFDNIRYNRPDCSYEEVVAAAEAARCDVFVDQLPEGYDTLVGERGVKLSGGQRQRVAIARAFLRNSPILVLDEATSSLDSETEKYIQDALHRLMANKTTIVIAHRLSTIREMDRIIVLRDGRIAEEGNHNSLLSANGEYSRYWNIQSGAFLLNATSA